MDRVTVANLAEAAEGLSQAERLELIKLLIERENDREFLCAVLEHVAAEHEDGMNFEVLSDDYLTYYELT